MQGVRALRGVLVALLIGSVVGSAIAMAAPRRAVPAPTRVNVVSASQTAILRSGLVRVWVSVPRARLVRVAFAGAVPRSVRFRRAGARVVGLRLTAGGRRSLARCLPRRLLARVAWGRRSSRAAGRSLRVDLATCR